MLQGRVRAAVRVLTEQGSAGVLDPLSEAHDKGGTTGKTVYEVLSEKHPQRRPADPTAFV